MCLDIKVKKERRDISIVRVSEISKPGAYATSASLSLPFLEYELNTHPSLCSHIYNPNSLPVSVLSSVSA